jgi:hypothetical protein
MQRKRERQPGRALMTKSNKTVTNPHLPVDGRGTNQFLRKEAVARTFAPQVTVRLQAKNATQAFYQTLTGEP